MPLILEIALQSGLFIVLLCLARPFLKKRLPALSRYALWLIPALRLLIPVSFKSVLGLWHHVPVPELSLTGSTSAIVPAPPVSPALSAAPLPGAVAGSVTIPPAQANFPPAETLLILLWLAGILVMTALFIRVNLRFYQNNKGAVSVGGIDAPIPVMLVDKNTSPCLAGLIKPRILLPVHVLASPELTQMVVLHEVTHYKHKDHLFTALRSLLLILWWWNPLVWVLARLSREDCESACDEGVIRRMTLAQRKDYGKCLVALLRAQHGSPAILAAHTAMGGNKKIIKERITMIANWKQKGRLVTLSVALIIALLLPFLFSSAQSAPPALHDTSAEAVYARVYADYSDDERIRIHYALAPVLGLETADLQAPWVEAARQATEAIKERAEALQKSDPSPLNWKNEDKAALMDALAASGTAFIPETLSVQDKAQRFDDLMLYLSTAQDSQYPEDEEEETWADQWYATFTSAAFRSVSGKVDFKNEWAPKVEELLKAGVPLPENGDLRHMLSLDFRLPEPGALPEAEALDKAKAAISSQKGWNADELDSFRLWSSAYLMEKDGTPVYWFSFSWDEGKLAEAGTLNALEAQRLEKTFPMLVTVKVHAQTGELYAFVESYDLSTPYNRTI